MGRPRAVRRDAMRSRHGPRSTPGGALRCTRTRPSSAWMRSVAPARLPEPSSSRTVPRRPSPDQATLRTSAGSRSSSEARTTRLDLGRARRRSSGSHAGLGRRSQLGRVARGRVEGGLLQGRPAPHRALLGPRRAAPGDAEATVPGAGGAMHQLRERVGRGTAGLAGGRPEQQPGLTRVKARARRYPGPGREAAEAAVSCPPLGRIPEQLRGKRGAA